MSEFQPGDCFTKRTGRGRERAYLIVEDGAGEPMKMPGGRVVSVVSRPARWKTKPRPTQEDELLAEVKRLRYRLARVEAVMDNLEDGIDPPDSRAYNLIRTALGRA